jgi:vancomycin resistance protein YoaR
MSSTITKKDYIKERNQKFEAKFPHYRQYAYLQKKFTKEIDMLPSELQEKYNRLSYLDKYNNILTPTNNMIKGVGKENIFSFLQSVLIQYNS